LNELLQKDFLCPTNEMQEPMSVQVLNFKHPICHRNLSQFMTILYIWLMVVCINITVMVQFTVSTFRGHLEEYLYCSWSTGNIGNVEWVCLW
jgi:hypothetical protein